MWATLALMTSLSLAQGQSADLRLTNERVTHGLLGPARDNDKLLPGDRYFVAFDIEGMKVRDDGKVLYSMGMEVISNKDNKSQYKQQPQDLETFNSLGGNRIPAFAHLDVGTDMPAGEYTLKVTVTDRSTKKTQQLTRKFEVLPRDFGLVRLQAAVGDPSAPVPAPPLGVAGQEMWVNFGAVGFERSKDKKQPNVSVEMTVFDEEKKPTLTKPFTGEVNADVPENFQAIPMQFVLRLNRPGNFTVELKATDGVSKKTAKLSFPLKVVDGTAK